MNQNHKVVQKISAEYLEQCKKLSAKDILIFLENYRKLYFAAQNSKIKKSPLKLISLKIEEELLQQFRFQCEARNLRYQTQIKHLMRKWLLGHRS